MQSLLIFLKGKKSEENIISLDYTFRLLEKMGIGFFGLFMTIIATKAFQEYNIIDTNTNTTQVTKYCSKITSYGQRK